MKKKMLTKETNFVREIQNVHDANTPEASDSAEQNKNYIKAESIVEEIRAKREVNSKHVRMQNGSYKAFYFNQPLHYYDPEKEEYEEIDNSLKFEEKTGDDDFDGYKNAAGDVSLKFPQKTGENYLAVLKKQDHALKWRFIGRKKSGKEVNGNYRNAQGYEYAENVEAKPLNEQNAAKTLYAEKIVLNDTDKLFKTENTADVNSGNSNYMEEIVNRSLKKLKSEIRYDGFIDGADLQYIIGATRLKENVIIKRPLENYDFEFEIEVENLDAGLSEDQTCVEFYVNKICDDGTCVKEIIYTMESAYMIDGKGAKSNDVSYEIEKTSENKYVCLLRADGEWINSEERVFPVKIDPTISYRSANCLTTATAINGVDFDNENITRNIGFIQTGNGIEEARTFIKWNLPSVQNVKIINAKILLCQLQKASYTSPEVYDMDFEVRRANGYWSRGSLCWSNMPAVGEVIDRFAYDGSIEHISDGVANKPYYAIDITKAINYSNGIVIKSVSPAAPISSDIKSEHFIQFSSEYFIGEENDGYDNMYLPYLSVTYMDETQIKGDKSITNSVNRAGTATLDLYTQNLRITHEDLSLDGEKIALEISHIYNANRASLKSVNAPRGGYTSGNIGMGCGWKTNLHQYLFPYEIWNDYNVDEQINDAVPSYVYVDQYGDAHVFSKICVNKGLYEYVDENGTGLILEPQNYVIRDNNGNKLIFSDVNYRLAEIRDANGNALNISHNAYGLIQFVMDSHGRTAEFIYSGLGGTSGSSAANPLLTSIKHQGQNVVTFSYDAAGKLIKISYPDGTSSTYGYGGNGNSYVLSSIRDCSGYKISYERFNDVLTIKESTNIAKIAHNSVIECPEKYGNETKITFETDRTTVETKDRKKTVHLFDKTGHAYCSYIDRSYYCNSVGDEIIERVECSHVSGDEMFAAEVGIGAVNKIMDGDFEETYVSGWTTNLQGIGGRTIEEHFSGSYCYKLQGAANSERYAVRPYSYIGNPQSIVVSCFAKANALPYADNRPQRKFRIGAQIFYTDGTQEEMRYADYNPYITDWQGTAVGLYRSAANQQKTLSRIDVQLEYSDNNGAAYFDVLSVKESRFALQSTERGFALERDSLLIPIEEITTIRYVTEKLLDIQEWTNVPTYDGDKFLLTGDDLIKMMTNLIDGHLACVYVDGECKTTSAETDKLTYPTAKPSIYIHVKNTATGGITEYDLLDGFKLRTKQIITVENGSDQKVRLKTDFKGNIVQTTVIDKNGKEFTSEYEYDDKGRQTVEKTFRDLFRQNTFDGYGNLIKETLSNTKETVTAEKFIQDYGYSNDGGNLSKTHDGRGSAVSSEYDTTFGYNSAYGRLTTVTLPGGQQINYNYNTARQISGISATVEGENCANGYSYTRGLLTRLVSDGSSGGSGTYAGKNIYTFEYDGFGVMTKIYLNGKEIRRNEYYRDSDYSNANETTFNYSVTGQVRKSGTSLSDYEIDCEKVIFGEDGMPISVKTYVTDGNGTVKGNVSEKIRITYDGYGRRATFKDTSDGANRLYTYTYKADGSLLNMQISGDYGGEITDVTDLQNRLVKKTITYGAEEREYIYEYESESGAIKPDGRLNVLRLPSENPVEYEYDRLGRVSEKRTTFIGTGIAAGTSGQNVPDKNLREIYNYLRSPSNDRTTQYVANIQYFGNGYSSSAVYTYDEKGNIKSVTDGGKNYTYEYDGLSRLIRENNQAFGFTKTYEYDGNGNILSVKKYAYTTGAVSNASEEKEYLYDTTGVFRDRLTAVKTKVNGAITETKEISSYDNLGNPCNYMDNVIEWEQGRLLKNCGGISYKYDSEGIRSEKVENGRVHKYFTENGNIHYETITVGNNVSKLWYYYDASGITGIEYNGTAYYYQKNLQGDVVRIFDGNGELVARYVYDAWGNHKVYTAAGAENTSESFIGNVNPIRYRGYYYDAESGLYYLQSRYYDPEIGRFINADEVSYIDPEAINGLNIYAYCHNNFFSILYKNITYKYEELLVYNKSNELLKKEKDSLNSSNHIFMVHKTQKLINNKIIAGLLGNISYTVTKQLNNAKTFYSFSSIGNSYANYGVGIQAGEWFGLSIYASTNIGLGFNVQISPWFTFGAGISLKEGISFNIGVIINDTTHELSINIGWGTAFGYVVALAFATSLLPGGRIIGAFIALFTAIFG